MFLLYWEVYALMELAVNLRNEDLHWFSVKRTFIDGDVYMRFNGVQALGLFLPSFCGFAFPYGHQMFLLVSGVSKDSGGKELLRFKVTRQLQQQQCQQQKKQP